MDLNALIGLIGGWTVIVVAVSAWLSRITTERILSKWRRDEQAFAETVRAELARYHVLLEAGIRGFGAGQDVIRERRVIAVEHLWTAVLALRQQLQGPVFFFGVLLPSEYDEALRKRGTFSASVQDLDDNKILKAVEGTAELEAERPILVRHCGSDSLSIVLS